MVASTQTALMLAELDGNETATAAAADTGSAARGEADLNATGFMLPDDDVVRTRGFVQLNLSDKCHPKNRALLHYVHCRRLKAFVSICLCLGADAAVQLPTQFETAAANQLSMTK